MIHAGYLGDTYYLLDVESGSLHACDEAAYRAGALMESGITDKAALLRALPDTEEYRETVDELFELVDEGLLLSPSVAGEAKPAFNKPVIKAMCLHIAHDCNLRCAYCFADDGKYRGERGLMSAEVARAALDMLIAQSEGRRLLEVDFFGGEPLINFGVVKDAVAYGRELEKASGKTIRFTMTTNAYAVTDEIADFINAEMKNLVISIDGRREIHDAVRKTAAGEGSFERVAANTARLLKDRTGEYYIRGTFTKKNLDFAEDVRAIVDLGFNSVSIEPVVGGDEGLSLTQSDLPAIAAEYERLAGYIERREREGRPVTFFHFMVDFASGPCLNKRLRGCGAGSEYVAVTPKGDIYPCHQFADKPEFKMGNVLTGELDTALGEPFINCHVFSKPECADCWAKYFCSGGCAADAYAYSGSIMHPRPLSCELERLRLNAAIALYLRRNE